MSNIIRLQHMLFALTACALAVGMYVSSRASHHRSTPHVDVTPAAASSGAQRLAIPVTTTQPTQGPATASITIVEWCDLRGPACREADVALRSIMREYPEQVRWVHRHYFDRTNVEAALVNHVARGAHHAAGKFWPLRERLLRIPDDHVLTMPELQKLVESLQIDWLPIQRGLERGGYAQHVNGDLVFAQRFGVTHAPGIFVNGLKLHVESGTPLLAALQRLVRQELRVAQSTLARGVSASALYDELTRNGAWDVTDARHDAQR